MRRFALLLLVLLLIGSGGCGGGAAPTPNNPVPVSGTQVAIGDPNLFLSPYNWAVEGTAAATTTHPGAYLTLGFQNTKSLQINVDTSRLAALPAGDGPVIRWQIDSGTVRSYQLVSGNTQLSLTPDPLNLGAHTCKLWFVAGDDKQDRWLTPLEALRITGLTLDAGGKTVAPTLLPKRILFFGDSITEGVHTESAHGKPAIDNDSTHAFTYPCAAALNAEFGVVGVPRQGWTIIGTDGSNVPIFLTAWPFQFANTPRLFTPSPDYVIVVHGVNDALSPADPTHVQAAVQSWLGAARLAMPTSRICIVVPFNGFEREAITQGVQAYKAATPTDTQVFLIDLGVSVQAGLTDPSGTPSSRSHDGIHPTAAVSEELGTQLAVAIQAAVP